MLVLTLFKKQPAIFWLIVMSSLMSAALWSISPFLSYFFVAAKGINIKIVATILGSALAFQFMGSIFGGVFAEKFGLKSSMVTALTVRSSGYLFLLLGNVYDVVVIMFIGIYLISMGAVFYMPAARAYISYRTVTPRQQTLAFSLHNSGIKLGMVIGPLLSAPFINNNPNSVFIFTMFAFLVILLLHVIFLQRDKKASNSAKKLFVKLYYYVRNPVLIRLLFGYMSVSFIMNFYHGIVGIFIGTNFGIVYFSHVLLIYCLMLVIGGPLLSGFIAKKSIRKIAVIAYLLVAIGMLFIATINLYLTYVGVACLAIGELMLILKHETTASQILYRSVVSAISLTRMATGIGILINSMLVGSLYSLFSTNSIIKYYWILISFFAIIATLVVFIKYKQISIIKLNV